jgi:hypothetical protein
MHAKRYIPKDEIKAAKLTNEQNDPWTDSPASQVPARTLCSFATYHHELVCACARARRPHILHCHNVTALSGPVHILVLVLVLDRGESVLHEEGFHDLEGLHALVVGEDNGAGPCRRQVRELLADARVRQLHLRDQLASHARHDTRRLEW